MGEDKDKYGTLGTGALKGPILEEAAREKERASIGGKWMNIVKGDRVVLLEGRDKGKIGKIIDVNTESCEFTVEGLNRVCFLRNQCSPVILLTYLSDRYQRPSMDDRRRRNR